MFDMGLRPKDNTLLWMNNEIETLISAYGCALSGIHCHLIDKNIKYPKQIEELLNKIPIKSIVFSPDCDGVDRTVTLGKVLPELDSIRRSNIVNSLRILRYPNLHHVITTYLGRPLYSNIINYTSAMTYTAYPDYADLVLPRLESDFPLFTYHYADENGNVKDVFIFYYSQKHIHKVNVMILLILLKKN